MRYQEFLAECHARLKPHTYFEIGCRLGHSLRLANCPAIAVDPEPLLDSALLGRVTLYSETSDEFFARPDLASRLAAPIDLAFVDGMHLAEFVLRDFANVEAWSHAGGVVIIDDVLPTEIHHASRERQTRIWCGDVYRIVPLLRSARPDLRVEVFDVAVKGSLLVWGLREGGGFGPETLTRLQDELRHGRFTASSVDEIRELVAPRPVGEIPDLLAEVTEWRRRLRR